MFGIDGPEFVIILLVLIVVVGPKDLPKMLKAFGKATNHIRKTAFEFRRQFDDAMREAELDDVQKSLSDITSLNPKNIVSKNLTSVFDPLREVAKDIKADLNVQDVIQATQNPPPVAETVLAKETVEDNKKNNKKQINTKITSIKTTALKTKVPSKVAAKTKPQVADSILKTSKNVKAESAIKTQKSAKTLNDKKETVKVSSAPIKVKTTHSVKTQKKANTNSLTNIDNATQKSVENTPNNNRK